MLLSVPGDVPLDVGLLDGHVTLLLGSLQSKDNGRRSYADLLAWRQCGSGAPTSSI